MQKDTKDASKMRLQIFLVFVLWVILGVEVSETRPDFSFNRHILSFAPKSKSTETKSQGCIQAPLKKVSLLGPAKTCFSLKPIKLTKALKMEKALCATDWKICSIKDKAVQQLSWKKVKMPEGCFAFNYGKTKAAGYGNHCQANLYFDGVLCCPTSGTKAHHHVQAYSSKKYKINNDKFADHKLNLI